MKQQVEAGEELCATRKLQRTGTQHVQSSPVHQLQNIFQCSCIIGKTTLWFHFSS